MKLLYEAFKDFGLSSRSDPERLRQMFSNAGFIGSLNLNWCGIALYSWCTQIYLETPEHPEVARHWLKVGREVNKAPAIGDIVIFWRESPGSWKGHVSIFIQYTTASREEILCLGGAQSGKVQITTFPKFRVLGFRRLERGLLC